MAEPQILPLTGLRFIAAFYVFLFHIHIRWPLSENNFLNNLLGQGAIGMSVFFILSGFVLAYQYAKRPTSYKQFVVNRFARIYPMYAFVAILTLPWIGITFDTTSFANLMNGIVQTVLLIVVNIFVLQAWFPPFFQYWHDGGTWSISVEIFCYMLLPACLPALVRLSDRSLAITLVLCWIMATLPGLSAKIFAGHDSVIYYFMPIFRLPEFAAGVCISLIVQRGHVVKINTAIQAALLAGFLLYIGFRGDKMPIWVGHNWIVVPFVTLSIYNLAVNPSIFSWVLSSRPFVWLGKISYSFYLLQLLLIFLIIDYHDLLVSMWPVLSNNSLFAFTSLAVLVAASGLSYHFIEEPSRRYIKENAIAPQDAGYRREIRSGARG